jgi:hydrogenase-4 component E
MPAELILVFILLSCFRLLGASRIGAAIRVAAFQGIGVSILPLFAHAHTGRALVIAVISMALKGVVFPFLLIRALERTEISREMRPFVGQTGSILIGLMTLTGAFALSSKLPSPHASISPLLLPASLFALASGFILLTGRRLAVSQVLGFIVLENGVFLFGLGVMGKTSMLVEAGVLLDLFVAVFVMGIMIFHISNEFNHIETDQLDKLKDT